MTAVGSAGEAAGSAGDAPVTATTIGSYRRPLVHGEPVEVAAGVFVIPDDRIPLVPNVGIVIGDDAALVVDTGAGPANGATVLGHARRLAGKRPLHVAITQFDPGHGFGVQTFLGQATIIFSDAQRERMRRFGPAYAETFRTDLGPEVAAELTGLEFVEPDLAHHGRLEIDLGGVRAVLQNWGPAHTMDDQTVLVDDRVLFGGDLFETRMFAILPYFPPFDTHFDGDAWIATLAELADREVPVVVPGHGEVTDLGQVREVHDYLVWVRERTAASRAGDSALADAEVAIERAARLRWPDWDESRWARTALRAFWREADLRAER